MENPCGEPPTPPSPRLCSGGEESQHQAASGTRLEAFPQDCRSPQTTNASNSPSFSPIPKSFNFRGEAHIVPASPDGMDPFVTTGRGKGLSPTASTFQPFGGHLQVLNTKNVSEALSFDLGIYRAFYVSCSTTLSATQVESSLAELDQENIPHHGRRVVNEDPSGAVLVQFEDIRDANIIHHLLASQQRSWQIRFVDPGQAAKAYMRSLATDTPSSGQLFVLASVQENLGMMDPLQVIAVVKSDLQQHGQLYAMSRLTPFSDGSFKAIAEFCNVSAALRALAAGTRFFQINGLRLTVSLEKCTAASPWELDNSFQGISLTGIANSPSRKSTNGVTAPGRTAPGSGQFHAPTMYPIFVQSPMGSNSPYIASQGSPTSPSYSAFQGVGYSYQAPPSPAATSQNNQSPSRSYMGHGQTDARRTNLSRGSRPHNHTSSHHNHVDTHRIREGIDVRTTIMLRNIPNKVDQAMLKRIIDESSWGKYDFMYLRIDFANDCNVGYAFINFVDPLDIIDFVNARGNQRWNCFKSDKIAEISYATIQGKDCLVQKFRNSSVMLEALHYRPKLYFTSNGPQPELAGQEEPFPEPDNQSKMKRSCENAEHVGLFTPNAGQHFRDEQRRRRSQYDRGTRLAALEEYDYEPTVQGNYGPHS